jgi:calcineurin-like phosphoesterase family protein
VKADDDLWIIGDFAYGPASKAPGYAEKIFKALPGRKHLVVGNHDDERTKKLPWASVQDMAVFDDEGRRVVLCHYPMITWDGARRGALHLFGHVHNNWEGAYHSVNVGVDLWGFAPNRLEAIAAKAERLPRNSYWEFVEPRL